MKKLWMVHWILFISLNIISAFILFSPHYRQQVVNKWLAKDTQVLSVVYGDLLHNGSLVKVVKSQTHQGIALDFYSDFHSGGRYLISRVEIPNVTDGFFDDRGQAVQMAVADLDGDGKMELLAPTFNRQMIAYLNPYHFSKQENGFVPFILHEVVSHDR